MQEEDSLVLECLEDVHHCLEAALKQVRKVRTVHVAKLEDVLEELGSLRRTLEEVSLPGRLVVEHLQDAWYNGWQVALETGQIRQAYAVVRSVKVEPFGNIRVSLGDLEIVWRDGDYSYYFYPDKVELRAVDEKSSVKLFFSVAFSLQHVEKFPELLRAPTVAYIHPQLEQWLKKVL